MNPENDQKRLGVTAIIMLVAGIVIFVGLLGWWLGKSNKSKTPQQQTENTVQTQSIDSTSTSVKSLITYSIPNGLKESSCPENAENVYVVSAGNANTDCDLSPGSSIKLSFDEANNTDCNQLQNVQNVSKHICISEFINDKKSLKAETIYNQDSSYGSPTSINAYYINTGKGVIKVEYTHSPDNGEYQLSFEQLAKSIKVI